MGGTISGGDITAKHGDTAEIRTIHFTRTFIHYITNSNATWSEYDYEPGTDDSKLSKITLKHNCLSIPYMFLNSSMTMAEIESHIVPSTSWRVVSAGFKVTNMIPILDTMITGADAAQMAFQISTRRFLIGYIDTKYNYFSHSTRNDFPLPNSDMRVNQPRTRQDGQLRNVSDIREVPRNWFAKATGKDPAVQHNAQVMERLMSIWNTDQMIALYAGNTFSYRWMNKDPYFFNNKGFTFRGDVFVDAPELSWENQYAYWATCTIASLRKKTDKCQKDQHQTTCH